MKLTTFFLFVLFFQVSAGVFSQNNGRFAIKAEQKAIHSILKQIEEETNYTFMYNRNNIDVDRKTDINLEVKDIEEVLDVLFKGTNVKYRSFNHNYVLYTEGDISQAQSQQVMSVSGKVTDSSGVLLPRVTVVIKGTTLGTITGGDGVYSLANVPSDAILVFSFVGMRTQEITVAGKSQINVIMAEETIGLEEVVAIGYGTLKKSDLTGSVGSVASESIVKSGSAGALQAIQGQIPGVEITSSSGRAGGKYNINIRGINTLGNNQSPLFVIDGIVSNSIDFLNIEDIERVDVLKDASSSAIYGSRGSNGVVIITTKGGTNVKQKVKVSYDGYYGIRTAARLPKMMNGPRWWKYYADVNVRYDIDPANPFDLTKYNLTYSSPGSNSLFFERGMNNISWDWYDLMIKKGMQQNHYVSVSGRNADDIAYVFGAGYQGEKGNFDKESVDRYSVKANITHQVSKKLMTGINVNGTFTIQEMGNPTSVLNAFRLPPFLSPYDEDGNLYPQPGKFVNKVGVMVTNKTSTYNPILEMKNSSDEQRNYTILGNLFSKFNPVDWLTLKTTFSYSVYSGREGHYWGVNTSVGKSNQNEPSGDISKDENFNYTWDNQINIDKKFGEHTMNLLGLYSVYSNRSESSFLAFKNLPYESGIYNAGTAKTVTKIASGFSKETMLSYAIRGNYTYKDKYLFTMSVRWDGSSKLAKGSKWGAFPSCALAWKVSEEEFMKGTETILNNLKLRISYGYTGNNAVTAYQTKDFVNTQVYYDFSGTLANGLKLGGIANNLLTWEKTRELNVGFDFGLFKNKIFGTIDLYNRLSKGLLMTQKLPAETGWGSMKANVGSVSNKGIEIGLTGIIIQTKDLNWQTSVTFNKNKNRIIEIYGGKKDDVGNKWFIGHPVQVVYNYKFDGVWQADEKDQAAEYGQIEGQAKVVDYGNKGITPEEDRVILGSPMPDWTGSLSSTLNFKNIDLSVSLFTKQGILVDSPFHLTYMNLAQHQLAHLDVESWYCFQNGATAPDGPKVSNTYPQPCNEGIYWSEGIGYIKDASFTKVKNICLGYTLNPELVKKAGIKSCRVYLNVLNPFVFTDYNGWDPEWASQSINSAAISSRTYQIGINVTF